METYDHRGGIARAFEVINPKQFRAFDNHERLVHVCDSHVGLCGFVAIHSTALGSGRAIGGTRYVSYPHYNAAISDALRLSRGMSYKCALAGLPFGGGKGVLMATLEGARSRCDLLGAYAESLTQLNVEFFTGEDVGIDQRDVEILDAHSDHIVGRPSVGGMPAPWAAMGVFVAIKAALKERFGTETLDGRVVAVKGLGAVGSDLSRRLFEAGAKLVLADVDPFKVERCRDQFPHARFVSTEVIHAEPCDVFSPCALRDSIDEVTVEQLVCGIVCGAENNQLTSDTIGARLHAREILYVPDFVANAGGLITVADELEQDGYSQQRVSARVEMIGETVREIFRLSLKRDRPTDQVASEIAQQRILGSSREN